MKKKIISPLFFICCLLGGLWGNAQTIVLDIDASCKPTISFNNMDVPNNGHLDLPILSPNLLQFYYKGTQADSLVTITILGIDPEATQVPKKIKVATFRAADNDLILAKDLLRGPTGGLQVNYMQPFRIIMGCSNNKSSFITCDFFPLNATTDNTPVTNVTQSQGNKSNNVPEVNNAPYKPGSAVYDALKLTDRNNLTPNELKRIIQFYWSNDTLNSMKDVNLRIAQNPYLRLANITALKGDKTIEAQSGGLSLSSLSLSSIGGLDVTNIVDGLAKFLVKRTKEELNTAFFEKFKRVLDSLADLQTLFPKSYNLLGAIGTEVYNYEKYIQNLRETFKDDIETLHENLPGIIPNHPAFFDRHPAMATSLRSGCYLVGALQQQVHPGDVLANYPMEYLDPVGPNWKGSIEALQLLSASMRDTSTANNAYWVNIKYMRQLVNTENAFMVYLGLMYQMAINDYDSVRFRESSLVDLLNNVAPRIGKANDVYNAYKTYVLRFAEKTDALNNMIANYAKPANDSLALELYKKYFDASADLIEYAAQVGSLPLLSKVPFLKGLPDTLAPYFRIANLATDLIIDINRKNYSAAINDAILIYDWVRRKPAEEDLKVAKARVSADETAKASTLQTSQAAFVALDEKEAKPAANTLTNLAKYGAFMSAMATAKTSDEVAEVIETFALPSGSSRIKRQTDFNVALNAYVGPYAGAEHLTALKKNATSFSAGLTAPVGIAFSWGNKGRLETRKNGQLPGKKSLTLFVPLIDIGTLAAFRFGNDSSSLTSTIQLKNIIAPGLYFYYGLGKCPISIGLGAQIGPQLRKVSATDIKVDKQAYIRYGFTIAVDLPLLNFYTKTK